MARRRDENRWNKCHGSLYRYRYIYGRCHLLAKSRWPASPIHKSEELPVSPQKTIQVDHAGFKSIAVTKTSPQHPRWSPCTKRLNYDVRTSSKNSHRAPQTRSFAIRSVSFSRKIIKRPEFLQLQLLLKDLYESNSIHVMKFWSWRLGVHFMSAFTLSKTFAPRTHSAQVKWCPLQLCGSS